MDGSLESIFNLYQFTSGRRLFALQQLQGLAKGFPELVKHCGAAIEHEEQLRTLEKRWAAEPATAGSNPTAQQVDVLVDRALGAIRDHAVAQAQGAPAKDPVHAQVAKFVKTLFPAGVHAVTTLPFVEELAAVDEIVALLEGKLAAVVKDLGLSRLAKRLAALAVEYRAALDAPPPSLVQWGHVRAGRAAGQGRLLQAIAMIVGKHHQPTAEGAASREALLSPILQQNAAIAQLLRARRAVSDVDPATGEDTPGAPSTAEPAEPSAGSGAGGASSGPSSSGA